MEFDAFSIHRLLHYITSKRSTPILLMLMVIAAAATAQHVSGVLASPAAPEPGAATPVAGRWMAAGALAGGRYAATATTLPDGRILVAGGYSFETRETTDTADLYVPGKGFEPTGSMRLDRNFAAAALLDDGTVLIAGGFREQFGTTPSAEIYDPSTGRFRPTGSMTLGRELFTATRLRDGRVLFTGGYSTMLKRTWNLAEIFDPRTGKFRRTKGRMTEDRFGHEAILLPDGRVLIVGGKRLQGSVGRRSAELFDPVTEIFTPTAAPMATDRDRPTLTLVAGAGGAPTHVLVAGGQGADVALARTAELFDLTTGRFTAAAPLLADRMAHTATRLPDGRVLLVGGWSASGGATTRRAELYDPAARRFLPAGETAVSRHDHIAAMLPDGSVLVAGGKQAEPGIARSPVEAERFVPTNDERPMMNDS
jgi:hypothetical protein